MGQVECKRHYAFYDSAKYCPDCGPPVRSLYLDRMQAYFAASYDPTKESITAAFIRHHAYTYNEYVDQAGVKITEALRSQADALRYTEAALPKLRGLAKLPRIVPIGMHLPFEDTLPVEPTDKETVSWLASNILDHPITITLVLAHWYETLGFPVTFTQNELSLEQSVRLVEYLLGEIK